MSLQNKYSQLIDYAKGSNVGNLAVNERNGVLYISGRTTSPVKDKMWDLYNKIDPDMRSGDLVMDIQAEPGSEEIYEVKSGENLSKIASKYPNMTWQKIYDANRDILSNPDLIRTGQKLKIPLIK